MVLKSKEFVNHLYEVEINRLEKKTGKNAN